MTTVKLIAEDISCNHCKMTIENSLAGAEGISEVAVDVDSKTVSVTYEEPPFNVDSLLQALDDLGYPAHQS